MIFGITISIMFFVILLICLIRIVNEAGFTLPQNRFFSFIAPDNTKNITNNKIEKGELIKVFSAALIFRICIFLLGFLAFLILEENASGGWSAYLHRWNIWDAPHYIEIAKNGYSKLVAGDYLYLVFFPFYPMLIKIFAVIFRDFLISGLIVSFLTYSVGCALMYKLVSIDYGKSVAKNSVLFLSVCPFTFFFGGIMTESTFFMIIIATFLAIRKHNWFIAGILGLCAALTRSVGVFMIVPAIIEWIQHEKPIGIIKNKDFKLLRNRLVRILPILIMPVGTLIYLYINYATAGDPFIFLTYQEENWSQGIQFFGKTINMISSRIFTENPDWNLNACIFIPGLLFIIFITIITAYGSRKTRLMYIVFMLAYFAYNTGATWPLSICRYLSCTFPMFWIMAEFTDKHKWIESPLIAIMAIASGVYLAGYLSYQQIM